MSAALGGMDLTSLFVNVVPSFSGMNELMKSGGEAGAGAFSSAFGEAAKPFGEMGGQMSEATNMFAKVGGEAAEAFVGAFGSLMSGKMPDLMSGFNVAEGAVDEFVHNSIGKIPLLGSAFDKVFDGIMGTLDAFKGPAGEFMNQLLEVGEKWQERARTIAGTTDLGNLPELLHITKELGAEGLPNLDMVANSIGQVHQRMEGLSDAQLKEFMKTLAQTSELFGNVKISTEALTGTMNAFKVAPADANQALVELGNTAKLSGMPINELLLQLEKSDVGLSAFGFNLQQAGSMLSDLNKHGIQAPRVLQAFTTAAGKFIAKGLTPEEGFKDLVDTVKHDLSLGTKDAAEDAMKHLKDIFGAKNAEIVFEGIKNQLIDLPNLIKPMGELGEGPEKALAATMTLEERLKGLKTQLETALEPLGTALASKLTDAGAKFGMWVQENQDKIFHALKAVADFAIPLIGNVLNMMAHGILAIAPYLNVIKSITVDVGKAFIAILDPLVQIAELVHLPGAKDAMKSLNDMQHSLDSMSKIDITKYTKDLGQGLEWAAGQMPKLQAGADNVLGSMEQNAKISEALKQHVTDTATGADQLKDAFQVTGDNQLQLVGSPEQIQATKDRMKALGLDITTGPEGVVTQVQAGNEQIKKDFEEWMKKVSEKPLNVKTQLDPTAPRTLTPDDLMDALGVPKENRFHSEGGIELPVRLTAVPNPAGMPGGPGGLGLGLLSGGNITLPSTGGAPSGGAEAWRGTVQEVVQSAAAKYPQMNPALWVDKLVKQIATESGGDPNITQKVWDINMAQGNPARGLMQMIPQTFAAHNISGGQYMDPIAQLFAAIDYVIKQYGMDKEGGPNFIGQGHGYLAGGGVETAHGGHSLIAHPHEHAAVIGAPHLGLQEHTIFGKQGGGDAGGPGPVMQIITIAPWQLHKLLGDKLGGAGLNQGMFGFGRQEGGDVPWMPGTQWGMDGIHALLAPGEHIWEEPAVRGAGGHDAMARMRALAKAGKLNAAFAGVNFGGMVHLQGGGTGSATYAASGAGDDVQGVNTDILGTLAIAHQYGLKLTAGKSGHGTHEVDRGYHDSGEAGDFSNGVNTKEELAFAIYMIQNYGTQLAEVIHSSPNLPKLVKDGKLVDPMFYGADTLAGHRDHVHIAIKTGNSPQLESFAGPNVQIGSSGPTAPGMGGLGSAGPGAPTGLGLGGAGATGVGLGLGPGAGGPGGVMTPQQAEELKRSDEHIAKIKGKLDEANAALDKLLAEPPEEQALDRDKIEKARGKRDKLQTEYDEALGKRNDMQTRINESDEAKAAKGLKGGKEGEGGMAEQLGGGLVKGIFQELGFPDVFGKAFTEWGIWKTAMGGLGWGMGLLNQLSGGKGLGGLGGPGGTAEGLLGGVGGGLGLPKIPGISDLMGGTREQQARATGAAGLGGPAGGPMAPGAAPAAAPVGAQLSAPGGPSFTQNNYGITTPQEVGAAAHDYTVDQSRVNGASGPAGGTMNA